MNSKDLTTLTRRCAVCERIKLVSRFNGWRNEVCRECERRKRRDETSSASR